MNGRSFASFLFSLIVVGILVGIGVGIYQAGVAQGVIDAGRFPAGAAVPVAGYGYGGYHGFDVLGLVFPLLFLFLIFGLLRAAFGHRRSWGHGYGHGWAHDDRSDRGPGPGFGEMPGPRWDREGAIAEMHRRMHEADARSGPASDPTGSRSTGSGTGNPDTSGTR